MWQYKKKTNMMGIRQYVNNISNMKCCLNLEWNPVIAAYLCVYSPLKYCILVMKSISAPWWLTDTFEDNAAGRTSFSSLAHVGVVIKLYMSRDFKLCTLNEDQNSSGVCFLLF